MDILFSSTCDINYIMAAVNIYGNRKTTVSNLWSIFYYLKFVIIYLVEFCYFDDIIYYWSL